MNIILRLLFLFRSGHYEMTDHAVESMDDDDLDLDDIRSCLETGRLRRSWPRMAKYEVEGSSVNGRLMRIVARLVDGGYLRIITVYEVT